MIADGDRVAVHFWGGPACGAVVDCPLSELPDNLCSHPDYDADYILFKQLATGKIIARYVRGSDGVRSGA